MNPRFKIESIDDPRLDPYRDLKQASRTRWKRFVIAEGWRVTEQLLQSSLTLESVLISEHKLEAHQSLVPKEVPLLVVDPKTCKELVGFNFHAGILAAAQRPERTTFEKWAEDCRPGEPVVALPQTNDPDNVGLIARTAAALGVRKMILSTSSSDPFSRRCLRLSIGAVLKLSLFESPRIGEHLQALRSNYGFTLFATVCDPDAPAIAELPVPDRSLLVLGNETEGLSTDLQHLCQHRVTIPIQSEVDSLNVSSAAGIMLYEWNRQRHPPRSNGAPGSLKGETFTE